MGGSGDSPLIGLLLLAAGPGAGVAVWIWIEARYRNRSARYQPEAVVHHRVVDLRASDAFVKHLRTKASGISGGNELRPEIRAQAWRVVEAPVEPPPGPLDGLIDGRVDGADDAGENDAQDGRTGDGRPPA